MLRTKAFVFVLRAWKGSVLYGSSNVLRARVDVGGAVSRKAHLHGTLETRHAIRHPTTIHTILQSHYR